MRFVFNNFVEFPKLSVEGSIPFARSKHHPRDNQGIQLVGSGPRAVISRAEVPGERACWQPSDQRKADRSGIRRLLRTGPANLACTMPMNGPRKEPSSALAPTDPFGPATSPIAMESDTAAANPARKPRIQATALRARPDADIRSTRKAGSAATKAHAINIAPGTTSANKPARYMLQPDFLVALLRGYMIRKATQGLRVAYQFAPSKQTVACSNSTDIANARIGGTDSLALPAADRPSGPGRERSSNGPASLRLIAYQFGFLRRSGSPPHRCP